MFTREEAARPAAALRWVVAGMHGCARHVHTASRWLDATLERRRVAAAALSDFAVMSERELLDIGLTRVDVQRVAWGGSK